MLFEDILHAENLHRAWKRVRQNKGSAGIDGITLDDYPKWAQAHWQNIKQGLERGYYCPQPVKRVEIPKPNGGIRLLGIPCVNDRLIQQAITQCLQPLIDPTFSEHSYGFRPHRSAHQAIKAVQSFIKAKHRYAVDIDLSKFFDQVDHDLLMFRLGQRINDKRVLSLIGRYLRAGISDDEAARLFQSTHKLSYKVFYFTVYSLGLRLGEGLRLQVGDIDAGRQRIHIRDSKGNKDRFVPLPQTTLEVLRRFWLVHRNPVFLFPNRKGGLRGNGSATSPLDRGGIQVTIRKVVTQCAIKKKLRRTHCATAMQPT